MDGPVSIAPADPETPEARACLAAYFALLVDRIPGVTQSHVPDPDPEAACYRPPGGSFLIAWSGTRVLGCAALKDCGPDLGEVKRLWVAPEARGLGLGRQLMAALEDTARALGKSRLKLDTNEHLPEAIALYRGSGWSPIPPYTPFPATHWFAKSLGVPGPQG